MKAADKIKSIAKKIVLERAYWGGRASVHAETEAVIAQSELVEKEAREFLAKSRSFLRTKSL